PNRLLEELEKRPLVCDGAMGTRLQEAVGDERAGSCLELLDFERPEIVLGIHRSYVEAGADILQRHPYGANALQPGRAARQYPLPLVLQVECRDGETVGGAIDLAAVIQRAEALGADVVGANCRIGPDLMLDVARKLTKLTELPVVVQPNAGNLAVDAYG